MLSNYSTLLCTGKIGSFGFALVERSIADHSLKWVVWHSSLNCVVVQITLVEEQSV